MSLDALRSFSTRTTPQRQPAGRATEKNNAGGYVFGIDDMARLRRFLILGVEGGTYYVGAEALTRDNAEVVVRLAETNPTALVDEIVDVSVNGRAPKQNPAIFALAIAASSSNEQGRRYALANLSKVCRIGTHLYLFNSYVEQFRGWGPALKRGVGNWYLERPVDKLAYQLLKYRQREGWTHRDLLRLSRPNPGSPERNELFRYLMVKAKGGSQPSTRALEKYGDKARSPWAGVALPDLDIDLLPDLVEAFEAVNGSADFAVVAETDRASTSRIVELIGQHDLSWEMLPDSALREAAVWEALINKGMPQTALMRQLPRLTKLGLTTGATGRVIAKQLVDPELMKRGRVHPFSVLVALRTYASGRAVRGTNTWPVTPLMVDALDGGFYASYGAVVPTGKRILHAFDVSGSMSMYPIAGMPVTPREAAAAVGLASLNAEKDCTVIGFSDGRTNGAGRGGGYTGTRTAVQLDVTPRRRLDDVCKYMASLNFGATDCALPMVWAMQNKADFDAIWMYTDNETFIGEPHPWQALKQYREQVGHDVKFGVVAMTSTGFSIADPQDRSSIDIAGMDTAVPQMISDFSAGLI
ncbi:TROVE domain-containing protein [Mycolicibacterium sphagni]|uniref:TROVE domain-containing protein n=1 Tax=Mycolicibacterium sphagni TaxID=1786 RepID=UPI0021F39772|nr:TROVE domain-containing protein [Mycolicibacterium sphagni]MCV7174913.1 TROVE domain-containing protein [Mycolicibacterium sphagni]